MINTILNKIIILLIISILASCSDSDSSAFTATTPDTNAPVFSGARDITAITFSSIDLVCNPASDDISAVNMIKYNIYAAANSSMQNFTIPDKTVSGVTRTTISGLTNSAPYFFVVRAEDSAGNEDNNTTEITATANGIAKNYNADVQPIFSGNCTTGCHNVVAPSAGLDLTESNSYLELIEQPSVACAGSGGRKLVSTADASASFLLNTLKGTGLCGSFAMPKNGNPFVTADIQTVTDWINEAAINN